MHNWTCTNSDRDERKGRARVGLASESCDTCRKRKIKCSRTLPCNRCESDKRECTYRHLPPRLAQLEDLSFSLHDNGTSDDYKFDLEPGPLLSNQSENLTGEMAISSTDSLSSDKDQIGPSLNHSQPVTPQQPDAVYTSEAHFENPQFTYNFTTSQETNDLKPAKDPIQDNFMQTTSLSTAASNWVNCNQKVMALLNKNPELYAKYSEFATVSFCSYCMSIIN